MAYNFKRKQCLEADEVLIGIGRFKYQIRLILLRIFLMLINLVVLVCAMSCFSAGRHARVIIESNYSEVLVAREEALTKAYNHEKEDLDAQEQALPMDHDEHDEKAESDEGEASPHHDEPKKEHHVHHEDKQLEMIQEMVSAVHIYIENILYFISFLLFLCWVIFGIVISYNFCESSEMSVVLLVMSMPYTVAMVMWEFGLAVLFAKMVQWAPFAKQHPMTDFYSEWMFVPVFLQLTGAVQLIMAFLPFFVYYLPPECLKEMPEHIARTQKTCISVGQAVLDTMRKDYHLHTSERPIWDMFRGKDRPHPRLKAEDTLAEGVTIYDN